MKQVSSRVAVQRKGLTVIPTSATQRSPMEKPLTFLPISTTVPIASCPGISYGWLSVPVFSGLNEATCGKL